MRVAQVQNHIVYPDTGKGAKSRQRVTAKLSHNAAAKARIGQRGGLWRRGGKWLCPAPAALKKLQAAQTWLCLPAPSHDRIKAYPLFTWCSSSIARRARNAEVVGSIKLEGGGVEELLETARTAAPS